MGGTSAVSRRLSKPRTRNSSSNLLNASDTPVEMPSSPVTSTDMDYFFGEHATTVSSQGDRRSRRKSRSKLRTYLYGSSPQDSSQSISSDEEDERHNSLVGAARGAKKRLSRTGSSIMQLSSAKPSTNYLSSTSSFNLASSDQEESVLVAEQIKEKARLDRIAAENHISSPVDEDKHVDSVMAPLRRRSLFTPGIATRASSDILRKPPPLQNSVSQADLEYYYNPAKPSNSPLATLAAMSHMDNGRNTPTQDVTHLGGLQLGSLRVTNGMDSPTSIDSRSIRQRRSFSMESLAPEEFQTASEGSDHEGRVTPKHLHRNLTIKATPRPNQRFVPTNQSITNLKQEIQGKRTSFPFNQGSSDPTSALANEYASEFDSSPFSYSETPLSREAATPGQDLDEGVVLPYSQEVDSKAPEMQALRTMIDKAEPTVDTNGTTEDAFTRLNGSSDSAKQNPYATSGSDSGYSSKTSSNSGQYGAIRSESSQGSKLQRKSLKPRLVTGQSELGNIRSKKEGRDTVLEPPPQVRPSFTVIPRHALAAHEARKISAAALETTDVRPSARSPSQAIVRKFQKIRPKSLPPPPVNAITVQGYGDLEQAHIPRVPSVIAARHAERLTQFPTLDHTFPSPEHVSASRTSTLTQIQNVPLRFPSPANALDQAALGTTNRIAFEDAVVTSDQTNDDPGASSVVRSPSWSAYGGGKQKKLEKKAVKERREAEKRQAKEKKEQEKKTAKDRKASQKQMRDASRETTPRSRRSSWGRAKSSERRSSERDAAIADFGTVTESLGASPYDIARAAQSPNDSSPQRNWHPHQISTAMPRTRPGDRMDTARVSDPSPTRGRTRSQSIGRPATPANGILGEDEQLDGRRFHSRPQTMHAEVPPMPALSAVDLKHHNLEWARHNQRNQSAPQNLRDARSGRPQSMAVLRPYMPAQKSSSQSSSSQDQQGEELTRSRPKSMAIDPRVEQFRFFDQPREQHRPTLHSPSRQPKSSTALPDLWTSGSLERRVPAELGYSAQMAEMSGSAIEDELMDTDENPWEAQQKAWSARRRSAGEALLIQKQMRDNVAAQDHQTNAASEQRARPQSSIPRSVTTDFSELDHSMKTRRSGVSPLVPFTVNAAPMPTGDHEMHHQPRESRSQRVPSFPTPAERRSQPRAQSIPRKRVGSGPSSRSTSQNRLSVVEPTQVPPIPRSSTGDAATDASKAFHRLSGRYDGGLLYGYEPGQGLGGSAGTRSSKTLASRKSVEVSKGYGIDLSDIPVFVAPAMH